eukprot:g4126.t1
MERVRNCRGAPTAFQCRDSSRSVHCSANSRPLGVRIAPRFLPEHRTLGLVQSSSFRSPRRFSVIAATTPGTGTVRIIVKGKKLKITDAIRDYAEKKVSQAIAHYTPAVKEADVTLSARGGDTGTKGVKEQKTEVTLYTQRNGVIRSEESADILYASIDLVCDKLERKLQKVKEKAISKGKWPGRGGEKGGEKLKEVEEEIAESVDGGESQLDYDWYPEIVRTKYLHLEPMTAVEAAENLEALGHDFLLFLDDQTKAVQVIYKRKEQGYGLLIPLE